jgi:hypothetical protein
MPNFKDVLRGDKKVWFELQPGEEKIFLTMAKEQGYSWGYNGEIHPEKDRIYLHMSVCDDCTIANVSCNVWFSGVARGTGVRQLSFTDFLNGTEAKSKAKFCSYTSEGGI